MQQSRAQSRRRRCCQSWARDTESGLNPDARRGREINETPGRRNERTDRSSCGARYGPRSESGQTLQPSHADELMRILEDALTELHVVGIALDHSPNLKDTSPCIIITQ